MTNMRRRLLPILVLALAVRAHGQPRSQPAPSADTVVVSLLTLGPGELLFDRFGHAAIRVRRTAGGLDSAWNWGMYDFDSPGFITRFLTGDTQYWMAGYPTSQFVNYYRDNGRAIWEQELALTGVQADSMLAMLRWNARPENKFYRYDYYLDNCSTRVRDAIDQILGGALKRHLGAAPLQPMTWRSETLRLAAAFPLIDFGMTFALGRRADAQVSPWEEGFIPMRLRDRLRSMPGLVRAERVLNPPGRVVEAERGPDLLTGAVLAALIAVTIILVVSSRAASSGGARLSLGAAGSVWHLVAGIAGTLILFAGLFTRHTFMGANTAVLLGTPASLALAWCYPRAWTAGVGETTRRVARALAVLAAAAAGLAVVAHGTGMGSEGLAPTALAAPVHIALTLALLRRGPRRA
jgi:hypothetical protein